MNAGSPACCRHRNSPQLPVWRSSLTWWQRDPELDGPGNMAAGCGSAAKLHRRLYPHNRCLRAEWQTTWTHGSRLSYIKQQVCSHDMNGFRCCCIYRAQQKGLLVSGSQWGLLRWFLSYRRPAFWIQQHLAKLSGFLYSAAHLTPLAPLNKSHKK